MVSVALTALATLLGGACLERPLQPRRVAVATIAAGCGPLLWYLLTRGSTPGELTEEFANAAIPVSRSHAGVALATIAATSMALALGPDRRLAARRMIVLPIGAALAAFGISVYLT